MERKPQTLANHAKFDPAFHFFLVPVLLINVIVIGIQLFRFHDLLGVWVFIMSLALVVIVGRMRSYATHLQDRIIRVEEHLRLTAILPESLRMRVSELTDAQLVALRFASDAEAPLLVKRALDEKLSRSDIKKVIVDWRPDYSRV
ncbi:MAG TPA: DUF6526 family protein [Candidatus Angelobacter sp.]|jgi:hypothetical protein